MTKSRPHQRVGFAFALLLAGAVTAHGANPLDDPGFPQSSAMQLKNHNFAVSDVQGVYDLGFRGVRKGIYWNACEAEKGEYNFDAYDHLFKTADELGMTVIACLFGGNDLYENDGRGGIQTEEGRQGFANFAAAAAARYKGDNIIWEIWNEPNVRTFWRKDGMHNSEPFAEEYTALVNTAVPAMLKANPDAIVAAGSVSNYWEPSYQWTEFCFKHGILKSGIKAWSVHPYGVKTPEEFAVGHGRTRELLKKYGAPDMVMIDTERGFAVEGGGNEEGWSGGSKEMALEFQAWQCVRQFMVDQMHDVRLTSWYEWDGGDAHTGSKFALLNEDGSPRPAGVAAGIMLSQLDGFHFAERIETGYEQDYVLVFANSAGEKRFVLWTAPEPGDTPDLAIPHAMKITGVDAIEGVDIYGKPVVTGKEGDALVVTVSGAPMYLHAPGEATLAFESTPPPKPEPVAVPQAAPDGSVNLGVLENQDAWQFLRNTGDGSFQIMSHGDHGPIGALTFDFTQSHAQSTPYVLAEGDANIEAGATELTFSVRTMIKQPLTFRVVDATGQTHQFKTRTSGSGGWEPITIPLTRRLEHWGGAADGVIHFPIEKLILSVPQPDEEHKTGVVEYSRFSVKR